MPNLLRSQTRKQNTRQPLLGNRYPRGAKLVRRKDGAEFVVDEDLGQGIRFKGYPGSVFDRTFFMLPK